MLVHRNESAVELVELGLILFGPLGHLSGAAQAYKHRNDVFFRRRWKFVGPALSTWHNLCLKPMILCAYYRQFGWTLAQLIARCVEGVGIGQRLGDGLELRRGIHYRLRIGRAHLIRLGGRELGL